METISQMEMLEIKTLKKEEIKTLILHMNSLDELLIRLDKAKERISKVKSRSMEFIQI